MSYSPIFISCYLSHVCSGAAIVHPQRKIQNILFLANRERDKEFLSLYIFFEFFVFYYFLCGDPEMDYNIIKQITKIKVEGKDEILPHVCSHY